MLWVLKIGVLTYLGFGALLYLGQRSMMYLPTAENPATDVAFETFEIDGVRIKVWVVNPGQPEALMYFGGNAEDVYYNAADFARALPGHTSYLVNYRGYGGSTGEPTEAALFADALALFDRLSVRHDAVDAVGRSLGSGVAVYLASQRPVGRIALITAHDSALAVARRLYPVYPVGWMLKDRFESDRHADGIDVPVLLLSAERDRVIPAAHTERLAEALDGAPLQQVVIEGAGHNDISGFAQYWQTLRRFLNGPREETP